jgi:hypothetical protein
MQGINWYYELNDYCKTLSELHGIELIKIAGILSALSPNCTFQQNIKSLEKLLRTKGNCKVSTFGNQKRKAIEILNTDDISEENIKTILGKGLKTRSFFLNIYRPETSYETTIDLWMIRYAKDKGLIPVKGVLTDNRYKIIQKHIQERANEVGLMPHQLQAALWTEIRGAMW